MGLYSPAPPARPFSEDKATLLTSWWITAMCAVVIVLRLIGRYVRVEKLFGEDKIAALVLLPLLLRMAFVHPVLLYGTNNVLLDDAHPLTDLEIHHRCIASRLVLVSRILHAAILWLLKLTTLAFFNRLVGPSGHNRHTLLLRITRLTLALTFLAVFISTLAECRPITHYWQVTSDPGGSCRQGFAYLLTHTAGNVLTDLLLVIFPVPIVVQSRLSLSRKVLLVGLFCLHLLTVAVAVYRVPEVLREGGYQATRTMWASAEVLVATFAANALTLGTFVRDTGLKKRRVRYQLPVEVEEGLRKGKMRGGARGGKKVSWNETDSDGDEDGRGRGSRGQGEGGFGSSENGVGLKKPLEGTLPRTESLDSLIPRSRLQTSTPDGGGVLKTTTIEVTVSSATDENGNGTGASEGLVLRPADGLVTASARGRARGSSVPLRELRSLSDSDSSHQTL